MTVSSIAPAARPIRAIDRKTGQAVALVPSQSRPNLWHIATLDHCDCRGYAFRGRCSHVDQVRRERGTQSGGAAHQAVQRASGNWPTTSAVSAEVAAKAAEYRSIWGSDE